MALWTFVYGHFLMEICLWTFVYCSPPPPQKKKRREEEVDVVLLPSLTAAFVVAESPSDRNLIRRCRAARR